MRGILSRFDGGRGGQIFGGRFLGSGDYNDFTVERVGGIRNWIYK